MNIKKLNEELSNLVEGVSFEYESEADDILADEDEIADSQTNKRLLTDIVYGRYTGKDLDEIVLSNLDKITVKQLTKILDNYKYYTNCGGNNLFPSNWEYKYSGKPYPKKLALAICRSNNEGNELEGLSDLFNIFYRYRGNLDIWGEAADVWEDNVLRNISDVKQELNKLDSDGDFTELVIQELEDNYPEICRQLQEEI